MKKVDSDFKIKKIRSLLLGVCMSYASTGWSQIDLQHHFKDCHVQGSITILDYKRNKWTYSDSANAQVRTLPASTFKIINSCIVLELGVIKDENEFIRWDGKDRSPVGMQIDAWNRDNNLKEAYRNSTVWFYVELAKRIGKKRYLDYLTKCHYGNLDISEKGDDFWNYGHFGVSPIDQIQFLKAFYEEKLPFSKKTYAIVKRVMISDKTSHQTNQYTMRYKTGWTDQDGIDIGWCVGYVERKDNIYFFATRLTKKNDVPNSNFMNCRKEITKTILRQMKVIE